MYRLAERLHYQHVGDLLQDMHAAELTGWMAYLRIDDEVKSNWISLSIIKALQLGGGSNNNRTQQQPTLDDDDDEVIDTTQPAFAQNFQGFITNPVKRGPQQPFLANKNTEITVI